MLTGNKIFKQSLNQHIGLLYSSTVAASKQKIIFVYNADSGLGNALLDFGKKYLSPDNYACALCKVSYGPFGMKRDWKTFVKSLTYTSQFLHKDEFREAYPDIKTTLPAMIMLSGSKHEVLLNARDFEHIHSLEDLKTAVRGVLAKHV